MCPRKPALGVWGRNLSLLPGSNESHCCHEFSATILIGDDDHECCGFAVTNKKRVATESVVQSLKSLRLIIMENLLWNREREKAKTSGERPTYFTRRWCV
jgi:hypothetical protein